MGTKSEWAVAGIEPSLEVIMSDPIMKLLLRRDRLTDAAVWKFLEAAQGRLVKKQLCSHTSSRRPAPACPPADRRRAEVRS